MGINLLIFYYTKPKLMKKLIYSILLISFLTLSASQSVTNGLTVLSRFCKVLPTAKIEKIRQEENKEPENSNLFSLLPVNSWDGKMMIR